MPEQTQREARNTGHGTSVDRVRAALAKHGLEVVEIPEFAESTATAAAAAAAIGTTVDRIVKSLVFMADDRPILVLISGPRRVDTDKVAQLTAGSVKRATADQVRDATGYAIGGVPPVGHDGDLTTFIDRDLLEYSEVWAAAGTPNSVFAINPDELVRITHGRVEDVSRTAS
jgi:prolyl-tRNA editing enzyme YbaK/EbsC (Cys-tRNA(Pro) deacylase)